MAREVFDPGCNRGIKCGIGGEIARWCKRRDLACCIIADCSVYGSCAGSCQRKGTCGKSPWIRRQAATCQWIACYVGSPGCNCSSIERTGCKVACGCKGRNGA